MEGSISIGGYTLIVVLLILLWILSKSGPYDVVM